jgi:hypothetical protein
MLVLVVSRLESSLVVLLEGSTGGNRWKHTLVAVAPGEPAVQAGRPTAPQETARCSVRA